MPATDSFTSTCAAVSAATSTFSEGGDGIVVLTRTGFWRIRMTKGGVFITKASSFGGSQSTFTYPVSRNDARELAEELLKIVN